MPAAGLARRLPALEGSKGLAPVWSSGRKPAIHCILDALALAQVNEITIITREGTSDIERALGPVHSSGAVLHHVKTRPTPGVAHTIACALSSDPNVTAVIGFPDVLFEPVSAIAELLSSLDETGADVMLGLFPADRPQRMDMVVLEADGSISDIQIKPRRTRLQLAWLLAAWRRPFTDFLMDWVTDNRYPQSESHLGRVFLEAIGRGFSVRGCTFERARAMDIGTPGDLTRATEEW